MISCERCKSKHALSRRFFAIIIAILFFTVSLLFLLHGSYEAPVGIDEKTTNALIATKPTTIYQCPTKNPGRAKNDKGDSFNWYLEDAEDKENLTDVHASTFDAWGLTVEELKEGFRPWIHEAFAPYLKNGSHIYESACGSGINLLLTAEILLENGISSLVVNGNDYLDKSISLANKIWSTDAASAVAHKGAICTGDSTNLSFVPSAMFDLVYTGYLDPLMDPLNILPENATVDERQDMSVKMCNSLDPEAKQIATQAQKAQENWSAAWVLEMIRIAKPGAPIIAENLDESICQNQGGWGGVDKAWWKTAISAYGFDIDPESIVIRPSGLKTMKKRYNILMRKNQ